MASAAAVSDPSVEFVSAYYVTEDKVIDVVEAIVAAASPLRITAFGSRARGSHRPESDLDLAVMLEEFVPGQTQPPVWRSDLKPYMSIDLLLFGKARHEFMKDSIISVHHDIANEGVTLYDAAVGSIDYGAIARIAR